MQMESNVSLSKALGETEMTPAFLLLPGVASYVDTLASLFLNIITSIHDNSLKDSKIFFPNGIKVATLIEAKRRVVCEALFIQSSSYQRFTFESFTKYKWKTKSYTYEYQACPMNIQFLMFKLFLLLVLRIVLMWRAVYYSLKKGRHVENKCQ